MSWVREKTCAVSSEETFMTRSIPLTMTSSGNSEMDAFSQVQGKKLPATKDKVINQFVFIYFKKLKTPVILYD